MKTTFKLTVVGVALICGLAGCSSQKEVPMLEGMDAKDAQSRIVELGFQVGRIDTEFTGQKDSGKVLRQVPSASSRVNKGTMIHLTVEESVTIPDLSGMDADSAKQTLTDLGLRVQRLEKKFVGGDTAGAVVSQTPAPGSQAAPKSAVSVVVDDFVVVPDLTGESYDNVRKLISGSGLLLGKKYYKASNVEAGTILEQIPEAGSKVARDTAVQLELAQAVASPGSRPAAGSTADKGGNPFAEQSEVKTQPDIGGAVGAAVGDALGEAINGLFKNDKKKKDKEQEAPQQPTNSNPVEASPTPPKKTEPAKPSLPQKTLENLAERLLK